MIEPGIQVLVVDDHPIVRAGLRQILEDSGVEIRLVEAGDGKEALSAVREGEFDLVLLDLTMPGRDGLDVLEELRERRPRLPVLVLSVHEEDRFAIRCIKLGAAGYLTKDRAAEDLLEAVRRVLAGGRFITPSLAEKLAVEVQREHQTRPHEALSNRELHVVRQIALGKGISEIAHDLSLSPKTVSTYRTRALKKMGMETNAEFIRYAQLEGLLDS